MKGSLLAFVTHEDEAVIDALKRIDANKQGFVIVIDDSEHVLGVLTDGDIRRGLIRGKSAEDTVRNFYTKNARIISVDDNFVTVSELFKNQSIKFLPIVDHENRLVNTITKGQMHAMLLLDIHADLTYDFSTLDEGIIDYEIFQRPWGFYKTTVLNDYYQAKVICVRPEKQLSLQSHDHREEYWIVVHGTGRVRLDDSVIDVKCGSTVFIPKGAKHRLTNTDKTESLILTEVQIGEYLGEDDIIRYEDDFGRA